MAILHELGHALGLKHPHDAGGLGWMSKARDAMEFTVMSYRSYPGQKLTEGYTNEKWEFAQTFMTRDIAALQAMYGADYTTNSGDTVYRWTPSSGTTWINGKAAITPGANCVFLTIWDGGGKDTYDFSAYKLGVTVNLAPGAYSKLTDSQAAVLNRLHVAPGSVYNALLFKEDARSLIENVIGGQGWDVISGNAANNELIGRAGIDSISGGPGDDRLYGGVDRDFLHGDSGNDILFGGVNSNYLYGGWGDDTLAGGNGSDWMNGEKGDDTFLFTSEITKPDWLDTIEGFEGAGKTGGDRIDLASIDADKTKFGNQAFTWGDTTLTGKGHVWAVQSGQHTLISANTDNDDDVEVAILLQEIVADSLIAADFIL